MNDNQSREFLKAELERYLSRYPQERQVVADVLSFLSSNEDCFSRGNLSRHFTASAFVSDRECRHVLLLHHKKLDKWLQPGGHADDEPDLEVVARKEVAEETGITNLTRTGEGIFDIDIHCIPEYKEVPQHDHYDVRLHFFADSTSPLQQNRESNALAWVPVTEIASYTNEESVLRMVRKVSQ